MRTGYIHQHEALGDHILCNGLNRELFKKYSHTFSHYVIWTKNWLIPTISFMFRDLDNVTVMNVDNCKDYYEKNNIPGEDRILINLGNFPKEMNWDQRFYLLHNIPFETRWDSFFCKRDKEREELLYFKINPDNSPYVIIHDRYNLINYGKIRNDLKHIKIVEGYTDIAFDYLLLLEKAEEIHCCDSGFKHIVESFPEIGKNLFYHNNPPRNINHYHTSRKQWIEV